MPPGSLVSSDAMEQHGNATDTEILEGGTDEAGRQVKVDSSSTMQTGTHTTNRQRRPALQSTNWRTSQYINHTNKTMSVSHSVRQSNWLTVNQSTSS